MIYLDMDLDAARAAKWQVGAERYGPVFKTHPLEELYEEILDSLNYIDVAEHKGYVLGDMREQFRLLGGRVQRAYREQLPASSETFAARND